MNAATAFFAGLLALAAAGAAGAQTVSGVVVDDATGHRIPGVLIVLDAPDHHERAEAVADDSGAFRIKLQRSGRYILSGSLIGYGDIESEPFPVGPGENVQVEVRLAVEAVVLEPLVVRERARGYADPGGFYGRMARGRRSGMGHFISRDDLESASAFQSTDLLRMVPGVMIIPGRGGAGAGIRMSGGCTPAIYVDGVLLNRPPMQTTSLDDVTSPFNIEGIEIYRGAMSQVDGYHDPRGCGLILLWTRRGEPSDEPWSWTKLIVGLVAAASLIFLMN